MVAAKQIVESIEGGPISVQSEIAQKIKEGWSVVATIIRWAHDVGAIVEHITLGEVTVHAHFYSTSGGKGYTIATAGDLRYNCQEEHLSWIPPTCVCGYKQPSNAGGMNSDTIDNHIHNRKDGKTSEHYKVRG